LAVRRTTIDKPAGNGHVALNGAAPVKVHYSLSTFNQQLSGGRISCWGPITRLTVRLPHPLPLPPLRKCGEGENPENAIRDGQSPSRIAFSGYIHNISTHCPQTEMRPCRVQPRHRGTLPPAGEGPGMTWSPEAKRSGEGERPIASINCCLIALRPPSLQILGPSFTSAPAHQRRAPRAVPRAGQ
jgi:hypothetical protein